MFFDVLKAHYAATGLSNRPPRQCERRASAAADADRGTGTIAAAQVRSRNHQQLFNFGCNGTRRRLFAVIAPGVLPCVRGATRESSACTQSGALSARLPLPGGNPPLQS